MQRKRILVIDDESDIREVATLALETAGDFDVVTANGGRRPLWQALNQHPDLILLDVMMPELDGPSTFPGARGSRTRRAPFPSSS